MIDSSDELYNIYVNSFTKLWVMKLFTYINRWWYRTRFSLTRIYLTRPNKKIQPVPNTPCAVRNTPVTSPQCTMRPTMHRGLPPSLSHTVWCGVLLVFFVIKSVEPAHECFYIWLPGVGMKSQDKLNFIYWAIQQPFNSIFNCKLLHT